MAFGSCLDGLGIPLGDLQRNAGDISVLQQMALGSDRRVTPRAGYGV